jgi:uncharacterized membrane protein YedE/YeeE
MKNALAYLMGLLFGLGLVASGMTDPQRVIAFLEIGTQWSESLLFVMGGALAVTLVTFPLILKAKHPILDTTFHLSKGRQIDHQLLLGSILFGVGWGLSGYCPGPLVVGLVSAKLRPWTCFAFFVAGLWIARRLSLTRHSQKE